jgi:hypothetical protein
MLHQPGELLLSRQQSLEDIDFRGSLSTNNENCSSFMIEVNVLRGVPGVSPGCIALLTLGRPRGFPPGREMVHKLQPAMGGIHTVLKPAPKVMGSWPCLRD